MQFISYLKKKLSPITILFSFIFKPDLHVSKFCKICVSRFQVVTLTHDLPNFMLKVLKLKTEVINAITVSSAHTSSWDLLIAKAAFDMMGLPMHFTVKKEWLHFSFKSLMLRLSAIAIDRTPKKQGDSRLYVVEVLANLFKQNKISHSMFMPENINSLYMKCKIVFWSIAKTAIAYIFTGYIDYDKKIVGKGKTIYPAERESNTQKIMLFDKDIKDWLHKQFSHDVQYS